jgi:hypothetical protein
MAWPAPLFKDAPCRPEKTAGDMEVLLVIV